MMQQASKIMFVLTKIGNFPLSIHKMQLSNLTLFSLSLKRYVSNCSNSEKYTVSAIHNSRRAMSCICFCFVQLRLKGGVLQLMCFSPLSTSGEHLVCIWPQPCRIGLCMSVTTCVCLWGKERERAQNMFVSVMCVRDGWGREWVSNWLRWKEKSVCACVCVFYLACNQ